MLFEMTSQWQPYREPLKNTILRTGMIAIVVGGVAARFMGGPGRWPMLTLLALWPSFGGHWVEVWFLNWLRPRIPGARGLQAAARVAVWFAGGCGMALAVGLTSMAFGRHGLWLRWWLGGVLFIGIELVAHLAMRLTGRPSFYDGCG
jgi:hypothetical protein